MNKLIFEYTCLDGFYTLDVDFDSLNVLAKTNMPEFEDKDYTLENKDEVIKLLNNVEIEKWDKEYLNGNIEDATKYKVKYLKDGKEYVTIYEESCYPYSYPEFIKVLKMIDSNTSYFD